MAATRANEASPKQHDDLTSAQGAPVAIIDASREADLKLRLDNLEAALAEAQERRANPSPADTKADRTKLRTKIADLEDDRDIAKRDYDYAVAATLRRKEAARIEGRAQLRRQLLAGASRLVADSEPRYVIPLRTAEAFCTELKAHFEAAVEFNQKLEPGEEPVPTFEQEAGRITLKGGDTIVEEIVDIREPVDEGFMRDGRIVGTRRTYRVIGKETRRKVVPGRRAVVPTPLHIAFSAPALRPGDKNFRVEGVERGRAFIDANGSDYP
jgi:hypothetical protein